MCGYSFIDEPPSGLYSTGKKTGEGGRHKIVIMVVAVLVIGLGAGLVSFFVSRAIEQSSLVTVKTGIRWKCAQCGKVYKNRVVSVSVKKSESGNYQVETAVGKCDSCRYGPAAGGVQDLYEWLSGRGSFAGFMVDVADAAAAYVAAHPDLYPARDPGAAASVAVDVDPALVHKHFAEYAGKPVRVTGRVATAESVKARDGSRVTVLQLSPRWGGKEYDIDFFVVNRGDIRVVRGDVVDCRLLPVDLARYVSSKGPLKAVVCLAMSVDRVSP